MCIRNKKYRKERTNKRHKSPGACQLNTPYCCFTLKKNICFTNCFIMLLFNKDGKRSVIFF